MLCQAKLSTKCDSYKGITHFKIDLNGTQTVYCRNCLELKKFECNQCHELRSGLEFKIPDCLALIDPEFICRTCRDLEHMIILAYLNTHIKPNIMKLVEEFKKSSPFHAKTRVLNDRKFKSVQKYLFKNVDSGIWASTLWGLNKKSPNNYPILLTEQQARDLIDFLKNKFDKETNLYDYIHAIGNRILIVHDVLDSYFIFRYYEHIITEDQILKAWGSMKWLHNCSNFIVDQCTICTKDLTQKNRMAHCMLCSRFSHIECKLKFLKTTLGEGEEPFCDNCNKVYENVEDLCLINYDSFTMNKETGIGRTLTWQDHIGMSSH